MSEHKTALDLLNCTPTPNVPLETIRSDLTLNTDPQRRRALAELVFSGKTVDGKRMGIYVARREGTKFWNYSLIGQLIADEGGHFPMSQERLDAIYDSEDDESVARPKRRGTSTKSKRKGPTRKHAVKTKPGPSAPIRRRRCCRPCRSRRRAGGRSGRPAIASGWPRSTS